MTTFPQFVRQAKMRHDFSDQIQVRYPHANGENYDTWISGEEVMARLKTASREKLIEQFSQFNLSEAKQEVRQQIDEGKKKFRSDLQDRIADLVSDNLGDNIFGDTLADKVRGVDSSHDPYAAEKEQWQSRLHDDAFRLVALQLAWIQIGDTLPPESQEKLDDWV